MKEKLPLKYFKMLNAIRLRLSTDNGEFYEALIKLLKEN